MNVLITGADGFLGSNTVRRLLKEGHRVRAFVERGSTSSTLDGLDIERAVGDVTVASDLRRALAGCDALVHAAGATSTWPNKSATVYRVNVEGTKTVVDTALRHGVPRMVYISSASVYAGGPLDAPGTEDEYVPIDRHRVGYVKTKAIAHRIVEAAIRERGLPAAVIAPTFMFGPFDVKPTSGQVLLALYRGELPALPPGGRNFVSVEDVAGAIALALERDVTGEDFIAGSANLNYRELCGLIGEAAGTEVYVPPVAPVALVRMTGAIGSATAMLTRRAPKMTYQMAGVAAHPQYYSIEKARALLGYRPRPIVEAVSGALAWFEANGYLDGPPRHPASSAAAS